MELTIKAYNIGPDGKRHGLVQVSATLAENFHVWMRHRRKKMAIKRDAVMAKTDGRCFYCGEIASTIDHFIPRSKGGNSNVENLVPSCKECNGYKANKLPSIDLQRELCQRKISRACFNLHQEYNGTSTL